MQKQCAEAHICTVLSNSILYIFSGSSLIMARKFIQLEMKSSPPWQVLDLVSHLLDPKTLAAAICVCKSWSITLSSNHLWHPFVTAQYPSLSNLRTASSSPNSAVSYHKLYSLGHVAEKRRIKAPPKPTLSLHHLIFAVDIHNNSECILTVVKHGSEMKPNKKGGVFRFDIEVGRDKSVAFETLDKLRITWNVVLEGFRSVFTMMDCEGKGSFVLGLEGWFSKELPSPGCCSGGAASGLVVDLRLGLRERSDGKMIVEKISMGVLSIVSWRYVCKDDALRYLQHFLLPCNN